MSQTRTAPSQPPVGMCLKLKVYRILVSLQHTHLAGVLPVANSVEVASKAMEATGAVCIAFHRRMTVPSRQAH